SRAGASRALRRSGSQRQARTSFARPRRDPNDLVHLWRTGLADLRVPPPRSLRIRDARDDLGQRLVGTSETAGAVTPNPACVLLARSTSAAPVAARPPGFSP